MARKTKEEKRIAAYRKKLKLLRQITGVNNQQVKKTPSVREEVRPERSQVLSSTWRSRGIKTSVLNEDKPPEIEKTKETSDTQSQRLYFIKDLRKSLLFIFLIITLEIIIYFASIKDYLRLGL